LYSFFALWQERQKANLPNSKDGVRPERSEGTAKTPYVSESEFLTMYERAFIDEWYETKKQRAEYFEKGKTALWAWYKKFTPNMPNALRLEQVFNLKIDQFVVTGAIDRIDQVSGDAKSARDGSASGGKPEVKIVDYKTGNVKEKFESGDKHQLLIYALAAQDPNILNAEVKELEYYFVDANESRQMKPTQKDLVATQAWVQKTIAGIQSGDFRATPGMHCKWCDFREICEFRAY
jgi:RecB family exonuclease